MKRIIVLITIFLLSNSSLDSQSKFVYSAVDKLRKISSNRLPASINDLIAVSDGTRNTKEQLIIQYVNDKIILAQKNIDWNIHNIIFFYHTSEEAKPLMIKRMKTLNAYIEDIANTISIEMGYANNRQTVYIGNDAKNLLRDAVEIIKLVIIEFENEID